MLGYKAVCEDLGSVNGDPRVFYCPGTWVFAHHDYFLYFFDDEDAPWHHMRGYQGHMRVVECWLEDYGRLRDHTLTARRAYVIGEVEERPDANLCYFCQAVNTWETNSPALL